VITDQLQTAANGSAVRKRYLLILDRIWRAGPAHT